MKSFVTILLLFMSATTFAQKKFDFCADGVKKAEERLSRGEIHFPQFIFRSSLTLRMMLEMDYGIINGGYSESCVQFESELRCHDSLMLKAINDKWGPDFLKQQRRIANQLDKEGNGYKTPSNEHAEKGVHELVLKGYADAGIRLKRFEIHLVISTNGNVIYFEIASLSQGKVSAEEKKIVTDALAKYSSGWTPGGLNGKSIQMSTSIQVGKYITGPYPN